jgi:hypothetical protein
MGKRKSGGTHGVRSMDKFNKAAAKSSSNAASSSYDDDVSDDDALKLFDGVPQDDDDSDDEAGVMNLNIEDSEDEDDNYHRKTRSQDKKLLPKEDEDSDDDDTRVGASGLSELMTQLAPELRRSVMHKLKQSATQKKSKTKDDINETDSGSDEDEDEDVDDDDDDDDGDDDDDDVLGADVNDKDEINTILSKKWGKRKDYWTGDTADLEIGQEFADAEDEEEAAKDLMQQAIARHKEADYFDDADEAFTVTGGKFNKKGISKSALNSHLEHLALDKSGHQVSEMAYLETRALGPPQLMSISIIIGLLEMLSIDILQNELRS